MYLRRYSLTDRSQGIETIASSIYGLLYPCYTGAQEFGDRGGKVDLAVESDIEGAQHQEIPAVPAMITVAASHRPC